jgi:hypothetical protein
MYSAPPPFYPSSPSIYPAATPEGDMGGGSSRMLVIELDQDEEWEWQVVYAPRSLEKAISQKKRRPKKGVTEKVDIVFKVSCKRLEKECEITDL